MHVWIVMEQGITRQGQEASDTDYSSRVFDVFVDQQLAKSTVDFMNARYATKTTSYSLSDFVVSEKVSPAVVEFANKQRAKDELVAEIAHHQKKLETLQKQLKNY